MLYSTCFSLLSLILAAVRTSAAAVGPVLSRSPTPRDQPQYFLKTQLNGGPVFANPVQVPSGIWVVGWSTTKHSATSVTLDGVGHLQFQSQPPMFLTFDNSTASTGVLFATLVPGGDIITGVYLEDNHLAWKGGNQTQEGWMSKRQVASITTSSYGTPD
ncbi:hypothetical protein EMCG_08279 [[Emmonsia] crescens]|uniref:DOMON domain-containing protein n=1 Tax=[Emmonsia] crescens TaxID=73230 RepID=A0A0G2I6Y6_9EURO|nr:hypothetical protein EMCG_08279 [Emmonsia crescens UAMH 3008]